MADRDVGRGSTPASAAPHGPATWRSIASAGSPPDSAASAARPRSPDIMCARRTAATGTEAALAIASTITPSRAPWRSSPLNTRHSSPCSGRRGPPEDVHQHRPAGGGDAGTRHPRQLARSPGRPRPRSSDGAAAGSGWTSRSVAQPMPMRPCTGVPVRKATAGATSAGSSRRQQRRRSAPPSRPASRSPRAGRRPSASSANRIATVCCGMPLNRGDPAPIVGSMSSAPSRRRSRAQLAS